MKEYELKKILNALIDYAYPDDPLNWRYKQFRIEFHHGEALKSKHGDYHSQTHVIRIFNMYRDTASLMITVLHELAHHIDHCRSGSGGHQQKFYIAYAELLYAAFDQGLVSPEAIDHGAHKDSRDHSKLEKIIREYHPKGEKRTEQMLRLLASPGYERKDLVKERSYRFNPASKTWEKDFTEKEAEEEKRWLKEQHIAYESRPASEIDIRTGIYIYASNYRDSNGTYKNREKLKECGFVFVSSRKYWRKEMVNSRELEYFKNLMPDVHFSTGSMK